MDSMTTSADDASLDAAPSARHELVLDEAARQLNSRGVLLTSLAEIAAKLGVSRSAMYYYVAGRDDLVFQCYRRAAELMNDYQGSELEALCAAMYALALIYPAEELAPLSLLVGSGALSAEGRERFRVVNSALLGDAYHRKIRRGIEGGCIRTVDIEARTLMLPGLLSWLVKDDVPTDPSQHTHVAREIANLVAVGFMVRE